MAAKCQIMTRSQLEKIDNEQLVQSFLLLQDEILGKQMELQQQNNMINERLVDLSKKFQDLLNENNIIKSRLAVVENTSTLLKLDTKKSNEQLINREHHQYKLEQCSRWEYIEIQGIPQNVAKNLEDPVIKIFEKIGISINKHMIIACHRLGKTTKTIVKFSNRKDAEHVKKSKKN